MIIKNTWLLLPKNMIFLKFSFFSNFPWLELFSSTTSCAFCPLLLFKNFTLGGEDLNGWVWRSTWFVDFGWSPKSWTYEYTSILWLKVTKHKTTHCTIGYAMKIKKKKMFKSKHLFFAQFSSKTGDFFCIDGKIPKFCHKYFFKWQMWFFLVILAKKLELLVP